MIARIEDAIRRRHCVWLEYHPGKRLVEPYVLGRSKDGNILLRAYQIEGESASGEHKNWKLFRLDRMANIVASDQTFDGLRPEYNRDDEVMKGGVIERL